MKKGEKLSIEHKKKISKSLCGHDGWNKGKRWKMSIEGRNNIRLAKLGVKRPNMTGARNPVWKGGKIKYWREQRLKKDNHICQKCGYINKKIMVVDHVKPKSLYPEEEYNINNLITLCPNCHAIKTLSDVKTYQTGIKRGQKWRVPAIA